MAAVLKTLIDQERLSGFNGDWPKEFFDPEDFQAEDSENKGPWLKVGGDSWEAWAPEVVLALYADLGGARLENPETLDLWLLAVGGEARRYWELQQSSISRTIMASLVERGANPLRALQIWNQQQAS